MDLDIIVRGKGRGRGGRGGRSSRGGSGAKMLATETVLTVLRTLLFFAKTKGGGDGAGTMSSSRTSASVDHFLPLIRRLLERFSLECLDTKTKVITLTNHDRNRRSVNQSELKPNVCNWHHALENAHEQLKIGCGFYF